MSMFWSMYGGGLGPGAWYAERTAAQARHAARDAEQEVRELRDRIEHMSLLTLAMWTLARERLGITDAELADRVQELDLSDGKLDGRVVPGVTECKGCGRKVSPRHARCLYCGREREQAQML